MRDLVVRRPAGLALLCVSLFLLLFPLTLAKPGAPPTLKADESAYYLMALSLAHDQDLRLDLEDLDRVFTEFPFRWVPNMIVMTDDGWHTTYYGKPYVYSLFAAPFAALFGANGILFFNMALLLGMVWMGAVYLARWNSFGVAALFSGLFFLLSSGFAYVFWIQTEVFNMAAVALSLFLAFHRRGTEETGKQEEAEGPEPGLVRLAFSGAALALAVYNKPVFLALALPVAGGLLLQRRWKGLAAWILGTALSLGAVAGLATVLTGHATPYLGVVRQGATLCEPGVMPLEPIDEVAQPGAAVAGSHSPTGNAWSWLFRIPQVRVAELAESITYFLFGRHTGLFLYLPFAVVATALFLAHGRRSWRRWLILASLVVVALFFLVFISFNWHGGGGFIGNRYFVCVYPAFLFLVTRIEPRWPLAVGAGLAGLFLAPVLFTPLSSVGPEPTLQHHVRSAPFRLFPLELSLRNVPGYHRLWLDDVRVIGRKDQLLQQGDSLWIRGGDPVELWMIAAEPLGESVFQVSSLAPGNQVRLEFEEAGETLELAEREVQQIRLDPGGPGQVRSHKGGTLYVYRLVISSEKARKRTWTRYYPPQPCDGYAFNESIEETFPVGAVLTYLGEGTGLDAEVFDLSWGRIQVPKTMEAGEEVRFPVVVTNESEAPWPTKGAARVKLAYHWLDEGGRTVNYDGRRTDLKAPLLPGERLRQPLLVVAPEEPGRYVLEIDPVFEHVAWFSRRNGGKTFRAPVEVLPAPADEAPDEEGAEEEGAEETP